MSRYILRDVKPYREVVLGWDPPTEAFFLQCFEGRKEAPSIWRPRVDLDELDRQLIALGIVLPDLLRRVLVSEQTGDLLEWRAGDQAHLQLAHREGVVASYPVLAVGEEKGSPVVTIELPDGKPLAVHPLQIFPDLESIGVE